MWGGLNVKLIRPAINVGEIKMKFDMWNIIASSTDDGHSENLPVVELKHFYYFISLKKKGKKWGGNKARARDMRTDSWILQTQQQQTGKQTQQKQPETPTSGVHFILPRVHTPRAPLSKLVSLTTKQLQSIVPSLLCTSVCVCVVVVVHVHICGCV